MMYSFCVRSFANIKFIRIYKRFCEVNALSILPGLYIACGFSYNACAFLSTDVFVIPRYYSVHSLQEI